MALPAGNIYAIDSAAAANNVNAGFFDPTNPNMLTDLVCDAGTGNTTSPVVSSATYAFVSGDVGRWLYIQGGTNWLPGFYPILSVAGGKATIDATIGNAEQLRVPTVYYGANTVVGCATIGTPTGGTFTIDYSRATTARVFVADFNAAGGSTTLTSATAAFTPVMVGNGFYQSTTGTGAFGTVGRYSIVSYVNATAIVLDRAPNGGTASVNTTGRIGGALSLGSSVAGNTDLIVLQTAVPGNVFYAKGNATYAVTSMGITAGSSTLPIHMIGFASKRGDNPTGASRPLFAYGGGITNLATYLVFRYVQFSGSGANVAYSGNFVYIIYDTVKSVNVSTTAGRSALGSTFYCIYIGCEAVSYRGNAMSVVGLALGCYAHDSNVGITGGITLVNTTISNCVTTALVMTGNAPVINCTLVGTPSRRGTGISLLAAGIIGNVFNSIITGFTLGIDQPAGTNYNYVDYNNFYNNTADVANVQRGSNNISVDPQFTKWAAVTGTTATTTAGNHLVDPTALFVTNGVQAGDLVYIPSGTGVTAGIYGIASVDSETQITVDIALTANATADKAYSIIPSPNFAVGNNMKATGYPGVFPGGLTTSYLDMGAVQRAEGGAGGLSFAGM